MSRINYNDVWFESLQNVVDTVKKFNATAKPEASEFLEAVEALELVKLAIEELQQIKIEISQADVERLKSEMSLAADILRKYEEQEEKIV